VRNQSRVRRISRSMGFTLGNLWTVIVQSVLLSAPEELFSSVPSGTKSAMPNRLKADHQDGLLPWRIIEDRIGRGVGHSQNRAIPFGAVLIARQYYRRDKESQVGCDAAPLWRGLRAVVRSPARTTRPTEDLQQRRGDLRSGPWRGRQTRAQRDGTGVIALRAVPPSG